MKKVNITNFRANLLKYLNLVQLGEVITITSKGEILATISPPSEQKIEARRKLDDLAKTAEINDVISPIGENWNALQ